MVIPVGLPDAQQLVVAEKDLRGRFTMMGIMPVLFSKFEGSDEPTFRRPDKDDCLDFPNEPAVGLKYTVCQ